MSLVGLAGVYSAGDSAPAAETSAGDPVIKRVAALAVPPRDGGAFKNLDPAYKRASYFARLHSFIIGGTWLVPERRVAPLPAAVPDLRALRDDHHDEPTVRRLARLYNPTFVVPLGIKAWLADRGITNAVELDWGQSIPFKGLTIVCTPAQHGSGRTLADQGRRLWSSWAVLGSQRFYFAGDTGYYRHFKEIGDTLGPFDLAALPVGSYTPREIAHPVHISPEEALQAWTDLRAKRFIGIHWGTFMLAREPYDEPPARIAAEVARRRLDLEVVWIPKPGETLPW